MKKIDEIKTNIESSQEVLKRAWLNHTIEVSNSMQKIGKPVGARFLRYQWEDSKDVKRSNVLGRFKQFLAGSYLARFSSGETIFADLEYFRSLFLGNIFGAESAEKIYFRINAQWFDAQKAFFMGDRERFEYLVARISDDFFRLRRAIARDAGLRDESGQGGFLQKMFRFIRSK